jgi:hypothetical protein
LYTTTCSGMLGHRKKCISTALEKEQTHVDM